jgi:DTW domain-containing protein YfiP
MDIETYLRQRRLRAEQEPQFRVLCNHCMQPDFTCYCAHLRPFDCPLEFVILIHPLEARRRIATGRMSHLSLRPSRLITGYDFSTNAELNAVLADPDNHCVILYPGREAVNLTHAGTEQRQALFHASKRPVIVVIDGTWSTARKMLRRSDNLRALPRICFTPAAPSNFRVRQQPRAECYSTLEAIHHVIELLAGAHGFDVAGRAHDGLLYTFNQMVEQQLEFIRTTHKWRRRSRHFREPQRDL